MLYKGQGLDRIQAGQRPAGKALQSSRDNGGTSAAKVARFRASLKESNPRSHSGDGHGGEVLRRIEDASWDLGVSNGGEEDGDIYQDGEKPGRNNFGGKVRKVRHFLIC